MAASDLPPHLKAAQIAAILDRARFGQADLGDIMRAIRFHEDLAAVLIDAYNHAPGRRPLSDEVILQAQRYLCSDEFVRLH